MYNLIPFVHTFNKTTQRPKIFSRNPYNSLNIGNQLFLGGLNYGVDKSFDSSPFGRHGTLMNMDPPTDWQPDPTLGRHCIVGDVSDEYLTIPPFKLGTSGTISFWLNMQEPLAGMTATILRISANVGGSPVRVLDILSFLTGNSFTGWYNNADEDRFQKLAADVPLVQNVWSFLELDWISDGATTLRINNAVVGSKATTTAWWDTSTAIFEVLRDSYHQTSCPAAKVADLCIWNRVLTESERAVSLWRDPMLDSWLYDPTRVSVPMVSLLPTTPPAAASPSLWMGVCI